MDEKEKEELLKEIEEYTEKIEKEPNNDTYWNNRGLTYNNLGEYNKAISDFDEAIKLSPNNDFYYNNIGDTFYNLKNYEKAIYNYSMAIKLNSNNYLYFANRGIIYFFLSKYKKAIRDFDEAIKLSPNNDFYLDSRGCSYYFLGMYKKAIKDFDEAIKLNPNNAVYFKDRGLAHNNLKDFNKAIKDFDEAIKLDPNNDFYYCNRANTYNYLKKYDLAIEDFNKAIKLNPNNAFYFNSRGIFFNDLDKYNEAIEDFDEAINLNPYYTSAYNNKGVALHNLGKFKEAIENFNEAIELEPNCKSAIKNKEFSLSELKNRENNNKNPSKKNSGQIDKNMESKYYLDYSKAQALHLNAETDEDFKKAEEEFSIFIKKYEDLSKKNSTLKKIYTEATLYLAASKANVKKLNGYLIFADILGWKRIWKKFPLGEEKIDIVNRLLTIKNELKDEITTKNNSCSINLISDTFIIYSKTFEISSKISKKLMELCLENNLVIRGAISYGECYNRDTVYLGPAVDEAASWHDVGEEIGIFYTPSARLSMQNKIDFKNFNLLKGDIKLKSGKLETFFINWYDEEKNKDNFYNIMKNEIITPDISLKYFNTENRLNEILHSEEKEK